MDRKKICILQNGLSRGGTDTFVVNLCQGLDPMKYDITVVNPCLQKEKNVRESEVLATGASVIHTADLGAGLWSIIRHFILLFQVLRKGRYDVFQTNIDLFNGPNLFVAWLAGVPIRCCHSHNTMQQKALVKGQTLPIRLYQGLMKWMCWTFSNRRSGCSRDAMEFLFSGKDWQSSSYPIVINNGIDLKVFSGQQRTESKMRELGLTARYHLVTVGRIIPQKNPLFLANVFVELCKMRKDVDLVWVGIGELQKQCETLFKSSHCLDRVHFLGSRRDIPEILPCCDLFFMPSAFEGLGIVIIEAQAAGLNCLVSDVVPVEANCGAVAYKSLHDSVESWASEICDFLDKKKQLMLDNAKLQSFSIQHMVEQMQQLFEK